MHRNGLSHRQQNSMFSQQPSNQARMSNAVNGTQQNRTQAATKQRQTVASNGFSQVIGMQQPRGGFDREFPQLSSGPRPTNNAAIWSNPTIRAPPSSDQRAMMGGQPHHPAMQQQLISDGSRMHSSLNPSSEDYRFGSRPDPRLSGPSNSQQNTLSTTQILPDSSEDFPPLTGLGSTAEGPGDRRGGLNPGPSIPPTQSHDGRSNSNAPGAGAGQASGESETQQTPSHDTTESHPPASSSETQTAPQSLTKSQHPISTTNSLAPPALSELSEAARFSMPGLQATMGNSDYFQSYNLATFGFDLDKSNHTPLHLSFGSLFVDPRRSIPEFHLPAAYNVVNVPPLAKRIPTFSDDTLFAIFYQYPRDYLQEMAAAELYSRDWRWHKEIKRWMRKEGNLPQSVAITAREERGLYVVFEVNEWQKETREMVLNFNHLESRQPGVPGQVV